MRNLKFVISEDYNDKKVLQYLRGEAKLSSRLVNSLKRVENGIMLNGVHTRTIDILKAGDVLEVNIPDDTVKTEPIKYPLDIIYEDSDILVVNKPAGLAMHPTHNHQGDTLANAAAAYFEEKNMQAAFRAVGRLDKCTSGLVLCALNKYAASRLSGSFKKTYYAVVKGEFHGKGVIDKPIYRPDPMKTLRAAGEEGDRAVTRWEALWTDGNNSLLKINLETGRTHQIRVHFASMGSPLAGDDMYGSADRRIDRAALHCGELAFTHPVTGEEMSFRVPPPEDFKSLLPMETFVQ
ncbi:MAG: RluA family pseudouridine synthase [Clostridiales bacterium]|nr:RluA family pseudouridine synthase [Clostridiales bacterium]